MKIPDESHGALRLTTIRQSVVVPSGYRILLQSLCFRQNSGGCERRQQLICNVKINLPWFLIGLNEEGFIRTAPMIGVSTNAGSVRINPVGLNRVAGLLHAMGIVWLGERDAVRMVTDTREREGREASSDAPGA